MPKTLRLDATDLRWLSEKIDHLTSGSGTTITAKVHFDYLDHEFTFKRHKLDDTLVLELKLA